MDATLLLAASKDRAQAAYSDSLRARTTDNLSAKPGQTQNPEKAREAAQQFEAFFVGQMMEYMTAGLKSDGVFGGGHAEETWRSMMNQEYGKEIAKTGSLGIADMVTRAMVDMQAKQQASAAQAASALDQQPEASIDDVAATRSTTNAAITAAGAAAGAARYAQSAAL